MSEDAEAEKELRALEARLDLARMNGDAALFEQVLGAEFQTTNPVGLMSGREQALADTRSGAMKVTSSQSIDITRPWTGQVIGSLGVSGPEDVAALVAANWIS